MSFNCQGHQARYLIALKLKIMQQKFIEADREHDGPLQGELAKEKEPPDKSNFPRRVPEVRTTQAQDRRLQQLLQCGADGANSRKSSRQTMQPKPAL